MFFLASHDREILRDPWEISLARYALLTIDQVTKRPKTMWLDSNSSIWKLKSSVNIVETLEQNGCQSYFQIKKKKKISYCKNCTYERKFFENIRKYEWKINSSTSWKYHLKRAFKYIKISSLCKYWNVNYNCEKVACCVNKYIWFISSVFVISVIHRSCFRSPLWKFAWHREYTIIYLFIYLIVSLHINMDKYIYQNLSFVDFLMSY